MPGQAILRASPGKPAPVPMSTSRQFSTGSSLEAYMDSPKWRPTISMGLAIDVRLMERFHLTKRSMYSRIFETWSSVGVMAKGDSPSRICRLPISMRAGVGIDSRLLKKPGCVNTNHHIYANMGDDGRDQTPSPYPNPGENHSNYKCSYNPSPTLV